MFSRARAGFTLVELMVVIAILGLLVSVLAFAVTRHFTKANADLDKVSMNKLYSALQQAGTDASFNRRFNDKANKGKDGREFFEACFRGNVFDGSDVDSIVSLGGPDSPAERSSVGPKLELAESSCSFTAPKMGELKALFSSRERTVVLAFNSRNWNNYDSIGYGALVAWSDGEIEYITQEDAAANYNISADEWAKPADLFGKKKPFLHTHE
jgi:prepilin-type N-terminal cleavage/methylation domain-containing protein